MSLYINPTPCKITEFLVGDPNFTCKVCNRSCFHESVFDQNHNICFQCIHKDWIEKTNQNEELKKRISELEPNQRAAGKNKKRTRIQVDEPKRQDTNFGNPPSTYTNSIGMEFVLIPAGEFMMGAVPHDIEANENEKPQHRVRITTPFYMGKYPVTQGEWEKVMGNNPSQFDFNPRFPVERVNWNDAKKFLDKLNSKELKLYRLPTEAEWEYACRGSSSLNTNGSVYYWGNGFDGEYCWYEGNSGREPHPVGEKKPNSFGLYDMIGNVWEWCEDWYDGNYYSQSPGENPLGPSSGAFRVLRGGSWYLNSESCRSSNRDGYDPSNSYSDNSFRVVFFP